MTPSRKIISLGCILILLIACGGRRGGGNKPPKPPGTVGGNTGGGNPPSNTRMSLEELRARQKALASALVMHPADKGAARSVLAMAKGAKISAADIKLDYWESDLIWRLAKNGDPGAKQWFRQWVKYMGMPGTKGPDGGEGWGSTPAGSQNHQMARHGGAYAAWDVLGQDGYMAAGGGKLHPHPEILMREMLGPPYRWPGLGDGHRPWSGEIIGSRHYGVRSASDIWAICDLGKEPEATLACEAMDKVWAFFVNKVRPDGVWPEDTIPQVRADRDDCYWPDMKNANEWPDPAIRRKYNFLTKHPEFSPFYSYVLLDYVSINRDFIGHVKSSACRQRPQPEWCEHIGGQGAYPDECDERSQIVNVGLMICGSRWRPLRSGR